MPIRCRQGIGPGSTSNPIPNAFEAPAPASPVGLDSPGATPAREDVGPRHVVFVYVVGTRPKLQNRRRMLEAYGDGGWVDWKPLLPPHRPPHRLGTRRVWSTART